MKKILTIAKILGIIGTANGAPITDPSQLSPNPTIIDFEQFTAGYNQGQPVNNPLVIGEVTFSIEGSLFIRDITGFPANGTEVESKLLEGEPDNVPLTIIFSTPVSEVLLGWWDPNFPGNFLKAYNSNNQLLEQVELTDLGPTQGVHATWIGFKRNSADISIIQVTPPTIVPSGQPYDNWGIDNIYHNVAVIPEQIFIDIKPGSSPNSINPKSKGRIPVVILSTQEFYAPDMVNKESLTFGYTGDEDSLAFCNPKGEDVNGDGLKDLVCHFYTQDTGFQCGDTEGFLIGETVDGTPIEGVDSVRIVPCT